MKKPTRKKQTLVPTGQLSTDAGRLLGDVRGLIETARTRTAQVVNACMVALYWSIGERIRRDVLKKKRAEYGEQIVSALSAQLSAEYGRGFSRRNLFNMIRLAEVYPQ